MQDMGRMNMVESAESLVHYLFDMSISKRNTLCLNKFFKIGINEIHDNVEVIEIDSADGFNDIENIDDK